MKKFSIVFLLLVMFVGLIPFDAFSGKKKKVQKNLSYVCQHCEKSKKFKKYKDCLKHICEEHLDEDYCNDFVNTKLKKSGKKWKCLECDKKFTRKERARTHIETMHCKIGWKCENCRETFANLRGFKRHEKNEICQKNQKNKQEKKDFSYVCNYCGQDSEKFEKKKGCLKHICEEHLDEDYCKNFINTKLKKSGKKWKCLECNNKYSQRGNARTHIEAIHFKIGYKCDDCESIRTSLSDFRKHKKEGMCKKKQKKNRRRKKEKEDFSYFCNHCNQDSKKFKNKENCLKHICKKHLENERYCKEFVNTKCKKTGKKWKCFMCDKTFPEKRGLKIHIEGVHCKIGYKCNDCGVAYATLGGFRSHKVKGRCKKEPVDQSDNEESSYSSYSSQSDTEDSSSESDYESGYEQDFDNLDDEPEEIKIIQEEPQKKKPSGYIDLLDRKQVRNLFDIQAILNQNEDDAQNSEQRPAPIEEYYSSESDTEDSSSESDYESGYGQVFDDVDEPEEIKIISEEPHKNKPTGDIDSLNRKHVRNLIQDILDQNANDAQDPEQRPVHEEYYSSEDEDEDEEIYEQPGLEPEGIILEPEIVEEPELLNPMICGYCNQQFGLTLSNDYLSISDRKLSLEHLCKEHLSLPPDSSIQDIIQSLIKKAQGRSKGFFCLWKGCPHGWFFSKQQIENHIKNTHLEFCFKPVQNQDWHENLGVTDEFLLQ